MVSVCVILYKILYGHANKGNRIEIGMVNIVRRNSKGIGGGILGRTEELRSMVSRSKSKQGAVYCIFVVLVKD